MSVLYQLFSGLVLVISFVLILGWWMNGYFHRRGIKCIPAPLPFVGNMMGLITQEEHFSELLQRLYHKFPGESYIGMMRFDTPTVLITDVEILKQICIKDFEYFQDHHFNQNDDVLFGKSLLALDGQKWRDMRSTLSPTFTGSKMRGMFQLVVEGGERMTTSLLEQFHNRENKDTDFLEVEMKDVYTRYANDVIASSAFGVKVNSFTERDNKFYRLGKQATDFSGLKFLFLIVFPKVSKALGIKSLSTEVTSFFKNTILQSMKERKQHKIVINDMLHLVMEARKGTLKEDVNENGKNTNEYSATEEFSTGRVSKREWDDEDILPQLVIFIAGGLETSSNLASFTTHCLTINPDVQERLQKEVDEVAARLDGMITYEALQKMKYLDMVTSETLRLWPGAIATDRKCSKAYTLPPPNSKSKKGLEVNVGDSLLIPLHAIQRDPRYFENPNKFDPERFSDENKHKIVPGSYVPFGMGPRNCIASRYGLMLSKTVVFHLLWKFNLVPTSRTVPEIKLKLKTVGIGNENGYWIGLKPRNLKAPS